MAGRLLDIKRLCVHDGPGIRTTVFLKGCSLRCRWCHNPESISPEPEIGLHMMKCVGCGRCVQICPVGAHVMANGNHVLRHEHCIACGQCVEACLADALEYFGREKSVEETVAAIMQDRTFYAQSGGGCTVSGGEPLLQAEFCAELFQRLRDESIHCAVDTSGAVPWAAFETVLPYTDMFLYDLKHTDETRHREQTGNTNRVVLDNLQHLAECNVPIEIRIPVIPGFNNDNDSFEAAGRLLSGLPNIVGVRLLPYHLAHSKYEAIGRPNTMPNMPPPSIAELAHAAAALRHHGLDVGSGFGSGRVGSVGSGVTPTFVGTES